MRIQKLVWFCFSAFVLFLIASTSLYAQLFRPIEGREDSILTESSRCLNEIMAIPGKAIPSFLFEKAEGIAIFPGLVRGGFFVGAQHGKGVLVVKNDEGLWEAPRFIKLTGGSLGFQAGIQSADIILIFCTRRSIHAAVKGQFTIGADASAAAGPVGRQASASTNVTLSSEIYSYSRSRGLFLGVAVDGCVLDVEDETSQKYYANGISESARQLTQLTQSYVENAIRSESENQSSVQQNSDSIEYSAQILSDAPSPLESGTADNSAISEKEAARQLLVSAHAAFMKILDPEWQRWLALPPEVLSPVSSEWSSQNSSGPSAELLTLNERLQRLSEDPKYAQLVSRTEFTQVKILLEQYIAK